MSDPPNVTLEDVIALVADETGAREPIGAATRLGSDLGVTGDDWDELIERFAKQFSVEMGSYLWFFHTDEESWLNLGTLFFKPPSRRVPRIEVTVGMLHHFACVGRWDVEYPPYELPERRYDLWVDWAVWSVLGVFVAVMILLSFIKP